MTRVAFIGLGVMGAPMARNIRRADHDLTVFNRTPRYPDDLVTSGARVAASAAEAARDAEVVCVMVPDSPDVEDVLLGSGQVFDAVPRGSLVIDFSTIRPAVAVALASEARARGLRFLDAPVSGGEKGAREASLAVMVGGDPADFEAARPVLEAVGTTVVHVGPSGSGQVVKAANQLVVGANIQALAEAFTFLEATGTDLEAALAVLAGGLAGSRVLDHKRDAFLSGSFEPGFRIDLHHKDMGIVTTSLREAGVVAPVAAVVGQLFASARANGDGSLDHAALLRGVQRMSGRPHRPDHDSARRAR